MEDNVMIMVKAMCDPGVEDEALRTLCAAACRKLDGMLLPDVSYEDYGEAYVMAAAWMTMDWLRTLKNREGITSLSAGDMTVRMEGGSRLTEQAMELMYPYLKDRGFVFQGVTG